MGSSTAKAQTLLVEYGYDGALDGIWGRKTQAAFEKAPKYVQDQVLTLYHADGKLAPTENRWIPKPRILEMIAESAERYGVSDLAPELAGFADREAVRKTIDGVVHYDSNSRNGGSKGIMQMQRGAWSDVVRADSDMPGYEKVWDPALNVRAGVKYAAMNAKRLRSRGIPVNADTLYLAHNQGMGFFMGWTDKAGVRHPPGSTTNLGGQSAEVQRLILKYKPIVEGAGRR